MKTWNCRVKPPETLKVLQSHPWSWTGSTVGSDQPLFCGSWEQLQHCPSHRLLLRDVPLFYQATFCHLLQKMSVFGLYCSLISRNTLSHERKTSSSRDRQLPFPSDSMIWTYKVPYDTCQLNLYRYSNHSGLAIYTFLVMQKNVVLSKNLQ